LWVAAGFLEQAEYHFYSALAYAACSASAAPEELPELLARVLAHHSQLDTWARDCEENFADRAALVRAEIARLEGRALDAMHLYDQAIWLARAQAFIHNEALANEVAARFYESRGFGAIARAYLRDARYCYFRWGADGKVRQLELSHPYLREDPASHFVTTAIGTSVEQLELATVVRVSQAISGEIVLEKLIDRLMITALQHAGAERGLLILQRGGQLRAEAEATTDRDAISVRFLKNASTPPALPNSVVQYVVRTNDGVIIDDASVPNRFSTDPYILRGQCRSILCLPLIQQATLTGVLYLENSLATHVFSPNRLAVLKLLASQAAVSLENAYLYADLHEAKGYLSEAQRLSQTGSFGWVPRTGEVKWSSETYRIFDIDPSVTPSAEIAFLRTYPDDRPLVQALLDRAQNDAQDWSLGYRLMIGDGSIRHIQIVAHAVRDESMADREHKFVGAVMDVTAMKQSHAALEKAFEEIQALKDQLQRENIVLREEINKSSMFEEIVGTSSALRAVLAQVSKVAPTDSTVLITGETGTGKELVARAIHKRSQRAGRAFVGVNCAAIPSSLIASELFGHEKGAFTGALQRRVGRFELAEGGTIFLDEIGDLSIETQVALLRVLQEHEFERVGGTRPIRTNVRVIAATNRDLQAAVAANTFRADLYYRLNVFPVEMPSLRERGEDIALLVEYFIQRFAQRMGKKIQGISRKNVELLRANSWPGNIRELQNVIERAVIIADTETLSIDSRWLSGESAPGRPQSADPAPNGLLMREVEMIESALMESKGRVAGPFGAAAKLGIPSSTLESKIQSLGIDKLRFKNQRPR
jgi:transcriptional regulator with GAF, ATPase, and Fis domain